MRFLYKARSEEGELRHGTIQCPSAEEAARRLRELGLFPVLIEAERRPPAFRSLINSAWEKMSSIGTIPLSEKTIFFRQLETFVGAGVSLGASLQHLALNTSCRPLAKKIRRMQRDVDEGRSLSRSIAERGILDLAGQAMAEAGEEAGQLDRSLALIAAQYERREALRKKIASALAYPMIVMLFSLVLLFVLFYHILPRFREVFHHMNLRIPSQTAWVFSLSEAMPRMAFLAIAAGGALFVLLRLLRRYGRGRFLMDSILLRVPVVGKMVAKSALSRCMRTLGTLLGSGVPLLRSLELSARATQNSAVTAAIMSLHDAASRGASLGVRASEQKVFPPLVAQLISAGEQTGGLEKMLMKIAEWYDRDLEESVKRLASVMEPFLILIVGMIAAAVIFALFFPILSLVQTLSLGG